MTSEPDSTRRRRPPTIDLTATEVKAEAAAPSAGERSAASDHTADATANRQRPPSPAAGRLRPHAFGAAIGAGAAACVFLALWFAGAIAPPNGPPPPNTDATNRIAAQLEKIQAELQSRSGETALTQRIVAVEAQLKALSDQLAAVNHRLDDVAVAAQNAREHADAAATAATAATGTAQSFVSRGEFDALTKRIAALEHSLQAITEAAAQRGTVSNDHAARAAVAAEALRAAVERGGSYKAELDAVKALGANHDAIAALEAFAASGIPSVSELSHDLTELTASMRKAAEPAAGHETFLGRLENHAKSLVRITPVNAPAGNALADILARLDADAGHGDINAALADIGRLPPSLKTLAQNWVQRVNARMAALAASQRIAAEALTELANANSQ